MKKILATDGVKTKITGKLAKTKGQKGEILVKKVKRTKKTDVKLEMSESSDL